MEEERFGAKLKIAAGFIDRNFRKIMPPLLVFAVVDAFALAPFFGGAGFREYFLPVGEGDSELVIAETGAKFLIDGGPANSLAVEALEKIIPPFDRSIDVMLMTHAQLDHFGGLMDVAASYRVGAFIWNGVPNETDTFEDFERMLAENGIESVVLAAGDRIVAGKTVVNVLLPDAPLSRESNLNETALIVEVDSGDIRTLFLSDASARIEEECAGRVGGPVDVLKVAHHGSKGSSSEKFLEAIAPPVAIIEVGKNGYGHPAGETLARLAAAGAKAFRTDEEGIVEIAKTEAGKIGVFAVK